MLRFAPAMAVLTSLGIVGILLMGPGFWLFFADYAAGEAGIGGNIPNVPTDLRWAAAGVALIGALLRCYGLLGLRRTFLEAAAGRPLSEAAVDGFRRFARVELAMVFVGIVQAAGFSVILSLARAREGGTEGSMSLAFGSGELAALFIALMLMFAAEIFAEGRRAYDENAQFL